MRSRLIILLLFVSIVAFGQSVPNTTTFTLQNVEDAISGTQGSLTQCFSNAISSYFNPSYSGSKNSLLNFRDYGSHNAGGAVPVVVTNAATEVTASYANLNGEVTSDGGSVLTARGFQISLNSDMSSATTVPNSGQTGTYQSGYNANCTQTTYYYRAYAINSTGTGYGDVVSFTTSSPTLLAYTFYSQVDGVTITDEATALQASNALYWGQYGANSITTRYATTMSGTGQFIYNSNNPACKGITSSTWFAVTNGTSVWTVNVSSLSAVTSSTLYTPTEQSYASNTEWFFPVNRRYAKIECYGAGGAGGGQNLSSDGGGGGGGGAYSMILRDISVGTSIYLYVGTGGTGVASSTGGAGGDTYAQYNLASFVLAKGGQGGSRSTGTPPQGGLGGSSASGIGTVKYSGGQGEAGRNNNTGLGGYGGSSAGTGSNGFSGPQTWSTATYPTASTPTGAYHGGNGGAAVGNNGSNAPSYAGGGGGSAEGTARVGGNGGGGLVKITY